MKDKLIIISRSVGMENDSRLQKMIKTLQPYFKKIDARIFDFKNERTYFQTGTLSTNTYYVPFGNVVQKKWLHQFVTIPIENAVSLGFIYLCRPSHVLVQNHRFFLCCFIFLFLRRYTFLCGSVCFVIDFRELPSFMLSNVIPRFILGFVLKNCDKFYVVNKPRLDSMLGFFDGHCLEKKALIIRNFVSNRFREAPRLEPAIYPVPNEYVYIQNPSSSDRFLYNSCKSILETTDYDIVVTGRSHLPDVELLRQEIPLLLQKRVHFVGMLPEDDLISILDNACFALILYSNKILNNVYAEPNRLFQSIARGVPVIVSNNITQADIVSSTASGLILPSDGSNIKDLAAAYSALKRSYKKFKQNAVAASGQYSWESQEAIFVRSFSRLK